MITLAANPAGGNSGYAIVPVTAGTGTTKGGNVGADLSFTATMTAPVAAGTYTYSVFTNQGGTDPSGQASSATYSITVGAIVTPPPTFEPTVPPTVEPTVPPTVDPAISADIRKLSPDHGNVGRRVTIRGTGFGALGTVSFGTINAKVLSWNSTKIVVRVPAQSVNLVSLKTTVKVPVWYRHAESVLVTVTPEGDTASTGVMFTVGSAKGDHQGGRDGHSLRDIPGHRGLFDGDNN